MRRNHGPSYRNSGAYTSPGTPEYGDIDNVENVSKTWCSERVPLPTSISRRHISAAALMPFNSGRALPSKWDDAERWITSPISGYGAFKNSIVQIHERRPKSKSGPLGPTGPVYLPSNYSPLTTAVLVPDGCLSVSCGDGIGVKSSSLYGEDNNGNDNNMAMITSVPGLSDLISGGSMPSSQDDKLDDGTNEDEAQVSRRDMATQMSPEGSTHSSSQGRLSFSNLRNSGGVHGNKDDIRDVQVDKGTTTDWHLNKQGLNQNNIEDLHSAWHVGETSKNISKPQREEAKISAWENLQKAKAEAAIRKLEMKLEKKRSARMDKIMKKLRSAEMKAQAMRELLSHRDPRNSQKGFSFCIYVRICNCFLCNKSPQ